MLRISRLALVLLLTTAGCGDRSTPSPPEPTPPNVTTAGVPAERKPPRDGFVGMESCAECHRERVDGFRGTRHFLATVETPQASLPIGFDAGRNRFTSRYPGISFEMSRSDEGHFMTAIREGREGTQRQTSRVDFVYGQGAGTDEAYFSWKGERVFELPVVWMHPQQCWAVTSFNPSDLGDYSRPLTAQCLNCHNTWIDCVAGSPGRFRRESALLGISCERCHGPGHEHVHHHRAHPDDETSRFIAHPGKLSRERQIDLCAQCHDNAIHFRRPPFSYRPGEVLSDYVRIPEFRHEEENHVANQVGGMRASRCFAQSETMTCVTCHDPHRPHSDTNAGARSCAKCHAPEACTERERLPAPVRELCVDCHMPKVNKVQVNFRTEAEGYVSPVKRWEHRIAVYPNARDATLLNWFESRTGEDDKARASELRSTLATGARERGTTLRGEYRFLLAIDAFREAHRLEPSEATEQSIRELVDRQTELDTNWLEAARLINESRLGDVVPLLERMLVLNPVSARAHGRLGTVLAALGQKQRGLKHLQTAIKLDPEDSYAQGMLGWLAYIDRRYDDGVGFLQRANHLDPMNPKLRYQLGLTYQAMGKSTEAENAFREVISFQSDHIEAAAGLTRLLLDLRRWDDAVEAARGLVQVTQASDPRALALLSESLARAGKLEEAEQVEAQADAARAKAQRDGPSRRVEGKQPPQ